MTHDRVEMIFMFVIMSNSNLTPETKQMDHELEKVLAAQNANATKGPSCSFGSMWLLSSLNLTVVCSGRSSLVEYVEQLPGVT